MESPSLLECSHGGMWGRHSGPAHPPSPAESTVFMKCGDRAATGRALGAAGQLLAVSGPQNLLLPRDFPGSSRGWSHQPSLYSATPEDGLEKQLWELSPDLLGDMEGCFPSLDLSTE